jgi:hypothetical protein
MIMKDLPAAEALFQYQGERTAGGGLPAAEENESGGDQRVPLAQRPGLQLLEPEAVAHRSGREPRPIVRPDPIDAEQQMAF